MPSSPHDAIVKAYFGQPDLVRAELEVVLPESVRAQLRLTSLALCPGSFVDDDLRQTHSDLLFEVRTVEETDGLVYLLLESPPERRFDERTYIASTGGGTPRLEDCSGARFGAVTAPRPFRPS